MRNCSAPRGVKLETFPSKKGMKVGVGRIIVIIDDVVWPATPGWDQ